MTSLYCRQLSGACSSLTTAIRTLKVIEKALRHAIEDEVGVVTLAMITRHVRVVQLIASLVGFATLETEMSLYLKNTRKEDFQFFDNYTDDAMKCSIISILKETESIHHASDNLPTDPDDRFKTEEGIAIITTSSEELLLYLYNICKLVTPVSVHTQSPTLRKLNGFKQDIKRLRERLPLKYIMSLRHCQQQIIYN
ncbi:uncharacterized protein LOC144442064 [Glandiceps talaboti]